MFITSQSPSMLNISLIWTTGGGVAMPMLCINRIAAVGSTFLNGSVDVTADISSISDSTFNDNITAQLDERITLVDDAGNVYYAVSQYTLLLGTTIPSR